MNCAKTTEPIVMSSGVWTREGPDNHTLGGGSDPPHRSGTFFGGGMYGHAQSWPRSIFLSLFARRKSDASSVYQSAAAAT